MSNTTTYPVPADYAAKAHLNEEQYKTMYQASINDPDAFWAEQAAEFLSWDKPWTKVREYDFTKGEAAWFIGGKLNITYNCIDRHLETRANQTAIIWEGDSPDECTNISYQQLHSEVCKLANALKQRGIKERRSCFVSICR